MKTFVKVFGWMSIAGALLLFPPDSEAGPLGAMRVNLVQGDVQVKIADTGEWVPASVNMPLVEGDELWVPEGSRAALQTTRGDYVRLDEGTALQILRMDLDSYQFHLTEGRVYVLNRAPNRSVLQFDTPDASIRAFGNARFRIDIPGGETDVSVFRGSVQTENGDGTTTVRAGNMLAVGADGYAELSPVPPPDDWQRWNAQRDRIVLARGKSYGYLPEELRAYSSDFEENGRWVNVPEYGTVWTPTVVVTADWAPYRHGRWVWRGGDYVWVGYEPWGWAPYHYGRWAFAANVGWLWVPPARGDVYWAPGYVGWVRTGDHVAWVPLAPRETYYGYGNHGRYSTNITNVNVNQVRVTNVYRNVERHQQHHGGQPDDLHHGPSVLRRPERGGEREGGLRKAPEHRGGKAPDQARGDELHPGGPVDPRGEAPAGGGPEGRREGTEAIPSAGQGTRPVRLTAASEARPPGGQERRETEARKRKGQGAATGRAQGTARPGGFAREPAGSGGAARQAEGSGAEGDRKAGAPATAAGEGNARTAAEGRPAGSGGAARQAEGSGAEGDRRPERPQPPPEKVTPEPPQRGVPPGAVEQRGKPKEAEPKATGRPERPQPPPEKVTPEPPQRGVPPGAVEQRGKPKEAEPKATGRPERPQPPPEKVTPEPPQRGGPPGAVEQRGKPKEAEPKEKAEPKAKPERPKGTPADNVPAGTGGGTRRIGGTGGR